VQPPGPRACRRSPRVRRLLAQGLREERPGVREGARRQVVDKAVEAQQGFAKDAYEAYVGQINKIGEIYLNTAREAYKPLETQLAQSANSVANAAKSASKV
jgi:imidazolonepropionase-like amidohydrolase